MFEPLLPLQFLRRAARLFPDKAAVIDGKHRYTYRQLEERVHRLSNALRQRGIGKGDKVAVLSPNSHRMLEAFFAVPQIGAVLAPLNYRLTTPDFEYILDHAEAKALLIDWEYAHQIAPLVERLTSLQHYLLLRGDEAPSAVLPAVDYEDALADAAAVCPEPLPIDETDLATLNYTSGTTARPKGVMLTHNSFASYILSHVTPADPEVSERNILTVPLYHIAGMQAMISAVYGGRSLIIQRQFEPSQWMDLVENEGVDRAMMVPTMLKMLMDHEEFPERDLSSLSVITYGAAPMPLEVIKQAIGKFPGVQFINAFGQTETAATITMLPPDDHVLQGSQEEVDRKLKRLSSIGKPLEDVEVRIVNEHAGDVVIGEVGEIVARGQRLMKGYWRQEATTKETIKDGWLYTGDLGYWDEDGYIFLAGRARDFIKRGGEMISPEEVEQVLHSHPDIEEAAIIGVEDINWGERVRAVVVAKSGHSVDESDVIEYCRQRLASFKKPESVVVADELPRNPMGKVLKRMLREEYNDPVEV
jgi:acyl-CoA synthetase (AMP-forming)/AMP-acid ligase II